MRCGAPAEFDVAESFDTERGLSHGPDQRTIKKSLIAATSERSYPEILRAAPGRVLQVDVVSTLSRGDQTDSGRLSGAIEAWLLGDFVARKQTSDLESGGEAMGQ